jgi:hypothetical protein
MSRRASAIPPGWGRRPRPRRPTGPGRARVRGPCRGLCRCGHGYPRGDGDVVGLDLRQQPLDDLIVGLGLRRRGRRPGRRPDQPASSQVAITPRKGLCASLARTRVARRGPTGRLCRRGRPYRGRCPCRSRGLCDRTASGPAPGIRASGRGEERPFRARPNCRPVAGAESRYRRNRGGVTPVQRTGSTHPLYTGLQDAENWRGSPTCFPRGPRYPPAGDRPRP